MTMFQMNRLPTLFDELFRDYATPFAGTEAGERAFTPAADILETAKAVEIHLDLPGIVPESIDVKLDGNVLTVSAARTPEKDVEGKGWLRQERTWGRFARSFTLPNTLDGTKPEAVYKHGVLTLTLPKREEVQPKSLKVKVEA
jgi:HSP20 family protein